MDKEIAELKRKAKAIIEAKPELEETIERVAADLDKGGRIAEVAAQYINDQYEQIQAEDNASPQEKAENEQTKKAAKIGDNNVAFNEQVKTPDEIKAEIQSLANSAWTDKNYRGSVEFSPSDKLRNKVKELFGHDIDTVFITDSDIRHIKKHHSENEESRGQVNLTPKDIADLYDVVNNFDVATLENADKLGNKKMLVVRSNNGMSYALLVERGKRKVQIKTAYKYKKKASVEMTDAQSPRRNARNDSLVKPSSVAPNVTETTGKVNGEPGNTNNAYKLQYKVKKVCKDK